MSKVFYMSYDGLPIQVLFSCADCGCNKFYRHRRDYKLTHLEGHYHCINCKKEVNYASDDFASSSLGVLYNYQKYETEKKGIFRITTNQYKLPEGWVCKEEELTIIGETDDSYVEKLVPSESGEWVGDVVLSYNYILPIGVHKSRLVRWTHGQLTLAI